MKLTSKRSKRYDPYVWNKNKIEGCKTWYSKALHKGSCRTILIYPPGFVKGKKYWEVFINDGSYSIFLGRFYTFTVARIFGDSILESISSYDDISVPMNTEKGQSA